MRGHNRQPFPPKIPGTDRPSWDVPTAIIYRPARSAMTSAPRPNYWVLEFEPSRPPQIEPLMGYTSRRSLSSDPAEVSRSRQRRGLRRAAGLALCRARGRWGSPDGEPLGG
ncbi:NADH dehydrogenase ubiquinone Fe-S protein 4 [Sphingobium yanoikuyae]|uniref:NADH dehydrogenase ubiquinone Fe-S protein 4 n=1 Tax=Sphingobium TaxID=165695 RepID=UPI001C557468